MDYELIIFFTDHRFTKSSAVDRIWNIGRWTTTASRRWNCILKSHEKKQFWAKFIQKKGRDGKQICTLGRLYLYRFIILNLKATKNLLFWQSQKMDEFHFWLYRVGTYHQCNIRWKKMEKSKHSSSHFWLEKLLKIIKQTNKA